MRLNVKHTSQAISRRAKIRIKGAIVGSIAYQLAGFFASFVLCRFFTKEQKEGGEREERRTMRKHVERKQKRFGAACDLPEKEMIARC